MVFMEDQSLYDSQVRTISAGLQNFIDSMVEEIVLEGKPFDTQKKYLRKFSEKEGLDYEQLENNIHTFIDIFENIKKTPNKLMEKFAVEKGHDCYITEIIVTKLLSNLPQNARFKIYDSATGKYGFMDIEGNIIIEPRFDRAGEFSEGLAIAEIDGKCGYIDKEGNEIVPFIYDETVGYMEGLAAVQLNGKWGFIDITGKNIVPCKYDGIGTGGSEFHQDEGFYEGLAVVELNGKRGYIDKTGNEVIPCIYDWACSFSEGVACVSLDQKLMIIDCNGEEAFVFNYDGWSEGDEKFSDGLLGVAIITDSSNSLWGFIDKEGREIVPCKYDQISDFYEGLAEVQLNDKMGFVDRNGKEVVPLIYDYAYDFSEGLACVRIDDGDNRKYGFIDKTGNLVIPCKYDGADSFSEGMAAVQLNDKWGFVDNTGKEIIPCRYDPCRHGSGGYSTPSFDRGLAKVWIDKKIAYIDKTERIVWIEQ